MNINASTPIDSLYEKTMLKVLNELDTAKTEKTIQNCKNQFERLSRLNSDQWMPFYYVAYCNIISVYTNPQSPKASIFLNEVNEYINKLKTLRNVDKSEVETLDGFYYTALIMIDPQVNGQKYFSNVFAAYTQAIKINPNNPRPICLLTFFNQQLPPFLQQKIDAREEVEKAKSLFAKENRNVNTPYWGAKYLNRIRIE